MVGPYDSITQCMMIRFGTCWFDSMPYFTQIPMNDRKIEHTSWKTSQNPSNFQVHFTSKKICPQWLSVTSHLSSVSRHGPNFTNCQKKIQILELSHYRECDHSTFFKWACRVPQRLLPTRNARPTRQFCSQNLRLSSPIAFGSDWQMTSRDLNLSSADWPKSWKVSLCPEIPE